jgi:hypothetical protein
VLKLRRDCNRGVCGVWSAEPGGSRAARVGVRSECLRRKEFCAAHGLSVHTLDAWRRRIAESGSEAKIVPVEIVEDGRASMGSTDAAGMHASRVFDGGELLRLIAILDGVSLRNGVRQPT